MFVRARLDHGGDDITTYLNGQRHDSFVARESAKRVLEKAGVSVPIVIEQEVELPLGGGLGTSGASALATALATAKLVGLKSTYTELAKIAHIADVVSGTGLGTVSGLVVGGVVVVKKPGAPGYDEVDRIPVGEDIRVVIGFYGPISKRDVISSRDIARIGVLGEGALKALLEEPSLENFVSVSRRFAERSGLITKRVREALELLDKMDIVGASMAMIGETVFALTDRDMVEEVVELLRGAGCSVYVSRISWTPARLLR